jgi:6-pyruvoyltetrahydropterin/6-carboxytetrahydropterin synthase
MKDKYTIRIEVKFRAGHRLLPPYIGKCNNVHGEGYTAIVEFARECLDNNGMVFDFGDVKTKIKSWIDTNWDHAYICHNDDFVFDFLRGNGFKVFNMGYQNPTAENMSKFLYDVIKKDISIYVKRVGIVESFEDSIAYYEEVK